MQHSRIIAEQLGIATSEVRAGERALEMRVSQYIKGLPFVFVAAGDRPGSASVRGVIERNTIALLSNFGRPILDAASGNWLGRHSSRERVRESGLWNNNHVDEAYDPQYLEILQEAIAITDALN